MRDDCNHGAGIGADAHGCGVPLVTEEDIIRAKIGMEPEAAALRVFLSKAEPPALPAEGDLYDVCVDCGKTRVAHNSEPGRALHLFKRIALPAEVVAVVAKLERTPLADVTPGMQLNAATLLRRYAQAVVEGDAVADLGLRLCDERDDARSKLVAAEKKLQAVKALCADASARCDSPLTRAALPVSEILAILREEH